MTTHNADAIASLRPGAAWSMQNDDLTTLVWLDGVQTRPSNAEIATEVARMVSVGIVPSMITRRQFFQQLAVQGIISQSDALAAIKSGTIPPPLQTQINNLASADQFSATMLISGEAAFHRSHWLTRAIGTAYDMTVSQIDQFFQAASAL